MEYRTGALFVRAAIAFLTLGLCLSAEARSERPNILIVVADDHSYPHAGVYGSDLVATPSFDRIANEGVLFRNAFASSPSCAPSRAAILAGMPFYLTQSAVMNHGHWPAAIIPYPRLLKKAGYLVGYTGKTWGPGFYDYPDMDNAGGNAYNEIRLTPPDSALNSVDYAANFEAFLEERDPGQPFHFWFGPSEPHRPLAEGIGERNGLDPSKVRVPAYYPDLPEVRMDILDYAFEIQWYDAHLGRMIDLLEAEGELENTLIIATSDHGMAFPRAKAGVYDAGMRVPFAAMWKGRILSGREVDDFLTLDELAPTILEIAGVEKPDLMIRESMAAILFSEKSGQVDPARDHSIGGIERHTGTRSGGPDFPMRTYRNSEYRLIKNYKPENPPAGPFPGVTWPRDEPVRGFGAVDGSPTKTAVFFSKESHPLPYDLCFGPRPMYELYDVRKDVDQVTNLALDPNYSEVVSQLEKALENELRETGDPRAIGDPEAFERWRMLIKARYPEDDWEAYMKNR